MEDGEEIAERRSTLPTNPQGTNGLIAATTGGKALEAGLEVLKEGGTAADAAMTTALCEVVQAAGSYVSFAGPLMMVYFEAASGKVYYLDAEYATPLNEKNPHSIPHTGGRTALVPGFMAGTGRPFSIRKGRVLPAVRTGHCDGGQRRNRQPVDGMVD